jgi:nucleotide-binding universal stress UspA family protein
MPGLALTTRVDPGDLADVLVAASRDAAWAVVDGRPGPVHGVVRTSLAARVAGHSECLVIVVPPRAGRGFEGPVVVGVDPCADEPDVMRFAFEEAAARDVPLRAVYVWSGLPATGLGTVDPFGYDLNEVRTIADRLLAEALAGWAEKYPQVPVERQLRHDVDVGRSMVGASAEAALMVVGARRLPELSTMLLGSVTDRLIHEAECPVAVVRRGNL